MQKNYSDPGSFPRSSLSYVSGEPLLSFSFKEVVQTSRRLKQHSVAQLNVFDL